MSGNEALQQTENACIERCKRFGAEHQQRWVKEAASSDILSHLYEALGERLALYTEHYRMPALIAYYNKLLKDNDGQSQAVIDTIRQLDNPENDAARAEKIIEAVKQKGEAQWTILEKKLNAQLEKNSQFFDMRGYMAESKTYQTRQEELREIGQKKNQLIQKKQTDLLNQEELNQIEAQYITLSIHQADCEFKMRREIVIALSLASLPFFSEAEQKIVTEELSQCKYYYERTAMKRIGDFCDSENLFQANNLMRELDRYSTVEEIAASDLYEIEKKLKKPLYSRVTDYTFCLLPEDTDLEDERIYNSLNHELKSNTIYIRVNKQFNEQSQSEPVIEYFVRSRAGGLLEGKLTPDNVRQILGKDSEDATKLIQHMEQGTAQDLESAKQILQANINGFKEPIYKQLEEKAREIGKLKNGTDAEREEYSEQYERHRKHVGIYRQNPEERNQIIQDGLEYLFNHVMLPIAEERARLCLELRKLKKASSPTIEKHKAKLTEISNESSLSRKKSCLSWSTKEEDLTRKIASLEKPITLLEQKIDYLSGALKKINEHIENGKTSNKPLVGISMCIDTIGSSQWPDSDHRQKKQLLLNDEASKEYIHRDTLNQARDYVSNFVRKLVGVILIPLRAILGSCAPESLQKQAFYNTQSTHRLFKTQRDWEKYNERTEKEYGLPLRDLAL